MPPGRILIVDDDADQRRALGQGLERHGYEVGGAGGAGEALARIAEQPFAVVVSAVRMPDMDGVEFVRRVAEIDEETAILLMATHDNLGGAVAALHAGALDYLIQPVPVDAVEIKLRRLLEQRRLVAGHTLTRPALDAGAETHITGVSQAIEDVRAWIRRAAGSRATVLITGPTGVGKELVARAIHQLGPHGDDPMLAVNVPSLPEQTVAAELFGHERGAFTGADKRRQGLLRAAGEGTVFLDEIGDLDRNLQVLLLRALEQREVLPLGSDRPVPYHARLLVATHDDLEQRVREGSFRSDLYYRLNVLRIRVPPLCQRPEDIPPLARALVRHIARRERVDPPVLHADAVRILTCYSWPGNVRELLNVLERAMMLNDEGRIEVQHLPADILETGGKGPTLAEALEQCECQLVARALRRCGGNRERAAKDLGLSPATLYRRLVRLGLKGYGTSQSGSSQQA